MSLVVNLARHRNTIFGRSTPVGKKNNDMHSARQVTVLSCWACWGLHAAGNSTHGRGLLQCYPWMSRNLTFWEQWTQLPSLPRESRKGLGCCVIPRHGISLMEERLPRATVGTRLERRWQGKLRGVREWSSRNIRSLQRVPLEQEKNCFVQLWYIISQSKES